MNIHILSLTTHYGKGYPSDRKVTSCVCGFSVPSTTPCTYIKVYFCFDPLCLAKVLVFLLQWIPGLCRCLWLCLREQQFAGALWGRQAFPVHGIRRLTREGRYGLLTWGQECCQQEAIAQVRPKAHRVQQTGKEQHNSQKRGKEVQESREGRVGVERVGEGMRLRGQKRTLCGPLPGSACTLGNLFPEVTFHLPILSQPPERNIETGIGKQGISGPGSYLIHVTEGPPSQEVVSSPSHIPPSVPMILHKGSWGSQLYHTDS